MAASTADRNTDKRLPQGLGHTFALAIAATTKIYGGIMVALNAAGFLVPASDTANLRAVGLSDEQKDNSAGANGDLLCQLVRGLVLLDNSTGSPVVQGDLFKIVFVEDDHTVAHASANGVRAGRFMGFGGDPTGSDTTQCWVDLAAAAGLGCDRSADNRSARQRTEGQDQLRRLIFYVS
jgi:hypothetical protein